MDRTPPLPHPSIFSTQAAYALGWSRRTLPEAHRAGLCHTILRGWHGHGPTPPDPLARHRELVLAGHLAYGDALVTSAVSACVWHDLPVDARDLDRLILTRRLVDADSPPRSHGRSTARVLIRSHTHPQDVGGDVPVLRPAAAVVEYALQSGIPCGVAAADSAVRRGLTTPREIAEAIGRRAGRTGIRPVSTIPGLIDPEAENAGESKARVALVRAGFAVESQPWVFTPEGWYRPDWRIKGTAALVELDGAVKYTDSQGNLRTDRIRGQRRRDRALETTGYGVVHLTLDDITDLAGLRRTVVEQAGPALDRPTPPPWEGRSRPAGTLRLADEALRSA